MADGGQRASWPRGIIFDLDGTLVDSAPDIAVALNQVLTRDGARGHSADEVRVMIGGGVPKLFERAYRLQGREVTEALIAARVAEFLPIYAGNATRRTVLYPGAREAIEHFASRGVSLGVCTNKPTEISIQILRDLGVLDAFGAVIGGESGRAKKPDRAPLIAAVDGLGVGASEALMVGDSAADVGAARAAGSPVLLVSYGYTPVPARDLGADGVIDRLDGLPQAIAGLRGLVHPANQEIMN